MNPSPTWSRGYPHCSQSRGVSKAPGHWEHIETSRMTGPKWASQASHRCVPTPNEHQSPGLSLATVALMQSTERTLTSDLVDRHTLGATHLTSPTTGDNVRALLSTRA